MIFDVTLIRRKARVRRALKNGEDTLGHIPGIGITDDIREHIQTAAMGHTHIDLVDAASRSSLDKLVEHRDNGLAALKGKTFLAEVFFMQKLLELLGFDQFLKQFFLSFDGQRLRIDELLADLLPDPVFLLVALDMPVFDANLAAVSLSQNFKDPPQGGSLFAVQAARDEYAVEVPDREAKIFEIELGRVMRDHVERVDIGEQMAADTVRIDQLEHVRLFLDLCPFAAEEGRIVVLGPSHRRIVDLKIRKDLVVKCVLASQKFAYLGQKEPAFCTLDDAMVIGARDGHGLADTDRRQSGGGHRMILRRVLDRSRRDDRALPGHQARIRRGGTYCSRICQRDRRPAEIGDLQLAVAGPLDLVIIAVKERRKIHPVRALDVGNKQVAGTVLFLDIDGDAEIYIFVFEPRGNAVHNAKSDIQMRIYLDGLNDRPRDDVRERHLAAALR